MTGKNGRASMTIRIDELDKSRIERLAEKQQVSASDCVREIISLGLENKIILERSRMLEAQVENLNQQLRDVSAELQNFMSNFAQFGKFSGQMFNKILAEIKAHQD